MAQLSIGSRHCVPVSLFLRLRRPPFPCRHPTQSGRSSGNGSNLLSRCSRPHQCGACESKPAEQPPQASRAAARRRRPPCMAAAGAPLGGSFCHGGSPGCLPLWRCPERGAAVRPAQSRRIRRHCESKQAAGRASAASSWLRDQVPPCFPTGGMPSSTCPASPAEARKALSGSVLGGLCAHRIPCLPTADAAPTPTPRSLPPSSPPFTSCTATTRPPS
jgi:hypothetical protein